MSPDQVALTNWLRCGSWDAGEQMWFGTAEGLKVLPLLGRQWGAVQELGADELSQDLPKEASRDVDRWYEGLTPASGSGGRELLVFLGLLSIFSFSFPFYVLPLPSPSSHFHFLTKWAAVAHCPWKKVGRLCLGFPPSETYHYKESTEH